MERTAHWDHVYANKPDTGVSWFQPEPTPSLEWVADALPGGGRVIDVGAGASLLADRLLSRGGCDVTVLDVSAAALAVSRSRLGGEADRVRWVVADITRAGDLGVFDLWHDRAVFHFLSDAADRRAYADLARRSVRPGGHLLVATFAPDGPTRCSDLDVRRYDAAALAAELGDGFEPARDGRHVHTTPWGKPQSFTYALFRRTVART